MIPLKYVRNLALVLFGVVGVLQVRQQIVGRAKDLGPEMQVMVSADYRQEVSELQRIRIRTVKEGLYCSAANVIQAELIKYERVTLVLHLSSDRLDEKKLKEHAENWEGPISLAVVFPEGVEFNSTDVQCAIKGLQTLRKQNPSIKEKLSVHFILMNATSCEDFIERDYVNAPDEEKLRLIAELGRCDPADKKMTSEQRARQMLKYPVNKARNVARKLSTTKYVLSADMDHFFSDHFETKMLDLAKRSLDSDPKTALVYRIFEIVDNTKQRPRNKVELHKMFLEYKAQEFHRYYGAHNIPKLYDWFQNPERNDTTEIQFYRPYTSHHWEPQFVSLNTIPYHDETFKYPQRDNTCLRWEMCRAGYRFAVVHDLFMYHHGFKRPEELKVLNRARALNGRHMHAALANFNKRMDTTYADTKHKCPHFE